MRRLYVLVACFALIGCGPGLGAAGGGSTTGATTDTSTVPARVAAADHTHEYRSQPPPAQSVPAAARTPQAAVAAFAAAYINWSATSVAADLRLLALASVGQARSEMQLAAARTARDYELRRGGIANSGTVEAIAPLRGQHNRFVVVTLERTTATHTSAYAGLAPAWHVTIATVQPLRAGWVISGWQPED